MKVTCRSSWCLVYRLHTDLKSDVRKFRENTSRHDNTDLKGVDWGKIRKINPRSGNTDLKGMTWKI